MEWYQMDAGKCLEFSKKMAVLRKMVRLGLISENEYIRAKNRIMSSYHILVSEYFKTGTGKRGAQATACIRSFIFSFFSMLGAKDNTKIRFQFKEDFIMAEHNDGMKVSNLYIAQIKQKHGY